MVACSTLDSLATKTLWTLSSPCSPCPSLHMKEQPEVKAGKLRTKKK